MEDGVIVLTDDNFEEELAKYSSLLVEFYAPWCGHCKKLAPEYSAAAKELAERDPPMYLAKIDATANKKQAGKHAVRGYPSLFFYKNGERMQYSGGRNKQAIVDWVSKRAGPASTEVTCSELKEKASKDKLALAFVGGENPKAFKLFEEVAGHGKFLELFQYYHVNDKDCAALHKVDQLEAGLLLFRQFDESPIIYRGELELLKILDWMDQSSVPTVLYFSGNSKDDYFRLKRHNVVLFRKPDGKDSLYERAFIKAAEELKGEATFVIVDVSDKQGKDLGG
mmetsp:Transcript_17722/g.12650  ORF Transcript_17722/g.12650 Transcript_17722/m.12650 type:complete len:281 (+) Transcript_17722:98-940(+)